MSISDIEYLLKSPSELIQEHIEKSVIPILELEKRLKILIDNPKQ